MDDIMSTSQLNSTLTAFFDYKSDTDNAVTRLRAAGITDSAITVTEGSTNTEGLRPVEVERGFFDAIAEFFFPEEDRHTYAEGLARGGFLVVVRNLTATSFDNAIDILDDEGAVNITEREAAWKSEGWRGDSQNEATLNDGSWTYRRQSSEGDIAQPDADSLNNGSMTYRRQESSGYVAAADQTSPDQFPAGDFQTMHQDGTVNSSSVMDERSRVSQRDDSHGRARVRSYIVG